MAKILVSACLLGCECRYKGDSCRSEAILALAGEHTLIAVCPEQLGGLPTPRYPAEIQGDKVINSIPKCVMGGACVALYGFIAVSGLQMLHRVDLGNNKNLYVVSAILVTGIGGLCLNFGTNPVTGGALLSITSLATALIVGIITNLVVYGGHMGSGEYEKDALTGAAESMGTVEFEDVNKNR